MCWPCAGGILQSTSSLGDVRASQGQVPMIKQHPQKHCSTYSCSQTANSFQGSAERRLIGKEIPMNRKSVCAVFRQSPICHLPHTSLHSTPSPPNPSSPFPWPHHSLLSPSIPPSTQRQLYMGIKRAKGAAGQHSIALAIIWGWVWTGPASRVTDPNIVQHAKLGACQSRAQVPGTAVPSLTRL